MPYVTGTAPGALPLVGHAWSLTRHPLRFLESLPAYGDLVEIRLGPTPAYVPCHPELLRQVLTDDRTFDKGGPFFDRFRSVLGNGLANCPHAEHRRQRRLIQPAFHRTRLERYGDTIEREIDALTEPWRHGQVVDAFPVLYRFALRTVMRNLFSAHIDPPTADRLQQAFQTALGQVVQRMFTPQFVQRLPLPVNRRYDRALAFVRATVEELITRYRRGGEDHGDLLSMLIAAREDTDGEGGGSVGFDDGEIQDQVIVMLLAGSESVAAVLSWALCLVARHPEVARRLQEEADAVHGGRPSRSADLPHLPCAGRVVTETLRLYPPGWLITRATTAEAKLAGRVLPAGTTVVFSPPVVHRRSDTHHEAERFDPDRWLPERSGELPRGSFVAFGSGARKCIGDTYAMTEAVLALSTIAGRWDISCTPRTDARPAPMAGILYPRRLLLRLTDRT